MCCLMSGASPTRTSTGPEVLSAPGTLRSASPVPSGASCSTQVGAFAEQIADRRLSWSDDDDRRCAGGRADGIDCIKNEWAPAEKVEHLRDGAAHPLALPRGEDHRLGTVSHVPSSIGARLSRPAAGSVRWRAMDSMTLDVDGPINVADFGGEGPVLLLVHGLGGSHLNWLSVAPKLAEHHRVYALDLPGFGRSPLAGRRSSIAANVDLLTRVMARLSDGPIALMGNSMGGLLSLGVAAVHPNLVKQLVLVDPAVPAPGGRSAAPGSGHPHLPRGRVHAPLGRAAARPRRGGARAREPGVRDPSAVQRRPEPHRAGGRRCAHRARGGAPRAARVAGVLLCGDRSLVRMLALKRQVIRWVRSVVAPTLLVQGDRDRLVSVGSAR